MPISKAEEMFDLHLKAMKLEAEREYRFHPERKWRFDFAWPDRKTAVEIEGVLWNGQGRHQTPKGMAGDCNKYNEARRLGWSVYRFTQEQVKRGEAIKYMTEMIFGIGTDAGKRAGYG